MDKIKSIFSDYNDIINEFTEKVVNERFNAFVEQISKFIDIFESTEDNYKNCLKLNKLALIHAVLDYFTDISRLKSFHGIKKTNEYKILAYEVYWLLRRRPIQVIDSPTEEFVFINEKFALSYVLSFLCEDVDYNSDNIPFLDSFIDSLYYYFKYRVYSPQDIEMIILAYKVGSGTHKNLCK